MLGLLQRVGPSATDMIRADHTRVLAAFHRYKADSAPARKQAIAAMVCTSLQIHASMEEEIFYPALRAAGSSVLEELEPEHEEMRTLIARLSGLDAGTPEYDQTFFELMQAVIHHVADEETMLLPHAELALRDRLGQLGARMMKRRVELATPHARKMATQKARAMPGGALMVAAGALLAGLYFARRRS
jgi:hypothetical protein